MVRRSVVQLVTILALAGTARADVLPANPGPANNGGSANWAIFFDLEALASPVTITHLSTANSGTAGAAFSVEVLVRTGTALGGPVGSGPGSSPAGWASLGTAPATQGATASGVSLDIDIPDITVNPGGIVGVAVRFSTVGPRYFGTGTPPLSIYQDANLRLTTGDVRSAPFTTTGSFFSSRALVGALTYTVGAPATCYANCDGSSSAPCLNVNDFTCFLNQFAAGDSRANCDGSTIPPALNINDFVCFSNAFAAGCVDPCALP
ncbi:MAG: hypothetical protein JNM80_07675 [Phycisphaerae bacterium]|nr:hypothetical protein [Phycisphaerae bacterium]